MIGALLGSTVAGGSGNMNGDYVVATTSKQGVKFNDDYASKGYDYFDVWAPEISTHYGEVFWTDQHDQPLPPAIVARFKGKAMAIQGYEQDQVIVSPKGSPGVHPELDTSVPINWAYNHHYMAWMTGADSTMEHVPADIRSDHVDAGKWDMETNNPANPMKWVAVDSADAAKRPQWMTDAAIPTSQMFSEGNGGESRKSFHGYPDGYAQIISNPETWHITPMQIDTRNRDCGANASDVGKCTKFTPSIEPKQARYGRGAPKGTPYSGVLECPCNGRYGGDWVFYGNDTKTKQMTHQYTAQNSGACPLGDAIESAQACFDSAAAIGVAAPGATQTNTTSASARSSPGCSVTGGAGGGATVTYNTNAHATGTCSAAGQGTSALSGTAKSAAMVTVAISLKHTAPSTMQLSPKGEYCANNRPFTIKTFPSTAANSTAADTAAMKACSAFCATSAACTACSVDHEVGINKWAAIPTCGAVKTWAGSIVGDIVRKIHPGVATLTLTGPADAWFGVGLNAKVMSDAPYTLLVNSTNVWEQQIGTCGSEAEHCGGDPLPKSITIVSNDVNANERTVVVTRALTGISAKHYTFSTSTPTINWISAIGTSQKFAVHMMHAPAVITLTSEGLASCICDLGANGELCRGDGTQCSGFKKDCKSGDAWSGGSLQTQRNPTCNSQQYSGGLKCCSHGRILLDDDQEIRPELLKYHMKFRFWFKEYIPATKTTNASHTDLPRIYWQTEANAGEYDIPPAFPLKDGGIPGYPHLAKGSLTPGTTCTGTCPDGPDCECVHTIHMYTALDQPQRLVYAGGHCHAPSCLSLTLYNNDTGKVVCEQIPMLGRGNVSLTGNGKYDEAGYIAIPPCLWGDEGELDASFLLPAGTTLHSIKRNNNTHTGHYGEMASWQMRGISV